MKKVLSIAGSDCSGGAGIQADIKTITMHGLYAMTAITALTAQNTTGVYNVQVVSPEFVAQQLDCIFQDIRPDAIKIGMVSDSNIIEIIAQKLKTYKAENIVIDPVMVASSGGSLLSLEAKNALKTGLFPLADILTPNIPEAEFLSETKIRTHQDMERTAALLGEQIKGAVLLKGGHLLQEADDLLYRNKDYFWYPGEKIQNENTHGTGCTLSSAIACNLAIGYDISESVKRAKEYVTGAIKAQLNLGTGSAPLNHMYLTQKNR